MYRVRQLKLEIEMSKELWKEPWKKPCTYSIVGDDALTRSAPNPLLSHVLFTLLTPLMSRRVTISTLVTKGFVVLKVLCV